MRGAQNVIEKLIDDIDETIKEINDKYLEKQRDYTRRSRAKQDPDGLRRKGTEDQWMYSARTKVDIQAMTQMPDSCHRYKEIQSVTLHAGEMLYIQSSISS